MTSCYIRARGQCRQLIDRRKDRKNNSGWLPNMVRLFSGICRQLQVSFVIWAWLICLTTVATLTVDERLQALEASNVEIRQVLAAKSERLKALESEVQQLKSTVIELTREKETSNKVRKKRESNGITNNNQPARKNTILRTCRETHLADPSLPSGIHWIDPDGQGVGDDPIQVYCNMATGTTSILHDSESPINVGHCSNPGCYSKSINYSATKRQMIALIELSNECHQSIRYDCNCAPFEMGNVVYSWWNDRNGNPQYFWAGNNASVHTCQCGIDRNCIESTMKCNCDSSLPVAEFDTGVITNKDLLPVTRLNFGRTWLKFSSGVHTLGRFECSGTVAINGMPSSCTDLWQIGHTLNGLYSIMGNTMVESVYCDFTKLYSEKGFQNRLGYVDIKSSPVYFYVQRNSSYSALNTPIPFELARTNIGGAMNLTSGTFTAPRRGVYFFTFSGLSHLTSVGGGICRIDLMLNGDSIGVGWAERGGGLYDTPSLQFTLNLKAGDRVWLRISGTNAYLYDSNAHHTHFTGYLLQEDISQSSSLSLLGSN